MNTPILRSLITGASRVCFSFFIACSVLAVRAQTIVVQDSFTLNGTTRVAGGALIGTSPEQQLGSALWKASSSMVFSPAGTIVAATSGLVLAEARIAISQPTALTTVSASIVNATADWMAVGFLGSDTVTTNSWLGAGATGTLWVLIRPNGGWTLFENGTTTTLASGSFSGYVATATYTLGLSYDPATQKARAFLNNGTTETSLYASNGGWIDTAVAGTSITATGFRINPLSTSVAGSYSLDNFVVTSAIPEPGALALCMGGVIGLLVAGKKHGVRRRACKGTDL